MTQKFGRTTKFVFRHRLPPDVALFSRVARWFILRPKILIWVYLGGSLSGKCWYILRPFTAIWYNIWQFGVFCSPFVICTYFNRFGIFVPRKIWQPCCLGLDEIGHKLSRQSLQEVR
jgi:hypothetical protein